MSTKAEITTAIAGRANGAENPVSTERALWTQVTDELFPTLIDILSSSTTYATPNNATQFPYQLFISKNGGKASINGLIRNAVNVDQIGTVICTITDPEMLVSAHEQFTGVKGKYRCTAYSNVNGATIKLVLQDIGGATVLKVDGTFPANFATSYYEIQEPLIYNTKN